MSKRTQYYFLGGLVLLLCWVGYHEMTAGSAGVPGIATAEAKFTPLNVSEPQLRLDLLAKLSKLEYNGTHRNIFSAIPPPPPPSPEAIRAQRQRDFATVRQPPPEPPLTIPGQLFGYAAMSQSGKRVAFFLEGDDVLVVEEGSTFMNRFRLIKIGNDSANVEEISTGKTATVAMLQPDSHEGPPGQAMNQ